MQFKLDLQGITTVKVPIKYEVADVINKDGLAYVDVNYTRGTEFVELKFETKEVHLPAPDNASGFTGICTVKGTEYAVHQIDGTSIAAVEEPVAVPVEEPVVVEDSVEESDDDDEMTLDDIVDEVVNAEEADSTSDLEDDVDGDGWSN